jgi:hypothetical protein
MVTYAELASTQTIDKPQLVGWRPSASIRRSVIPWTWVYMLFRRSHGVSRLIAADACAYVCRTPGKIDRAAGSELASRLQTVITGDGVILIGERRVILQPVLRRSSLSPSPFLFDGRLNRVK